MSTPVQAATSQIGTVDAERVEDALSLIAPKWTTWSAQTLAQQGGPMRVRDVAVRLPFLSEHLVGKRLAQMHADGLMTRAGARHGAPYQLSGFGNALSPVHRALSDWSQAHLPVGKVAGAERIEDALRRLHLRHSTAVIQVLDAGGPMRFVPIAEQVGLDNGFTRQRLIRLQLDGLVTRTGPRHGDPYVLTAAGRALGPVFAAVEHWSDPVAAASRPCPGRGGHAHPHRHPSGVGRHPDRSRPASEHRRAELPVQPRPAATTAGAGGRPCPVRPLSWPVIRMASSTRSPSPPPLMPACSRVVRSRPRAGPFPTVSPVGAGTDQRRSAALARTSQAGATPTIASAAAGVPAPGPSRRR